MLACHVSHEIVTWTAHGELTHRQPKTTCRNITMPAHIVWVQFGCVDGSTLHRTLHNYLTPNLLEATLRGAHELLVGE